MDAVHCHQGITLPYGFLESKRGLEEKASKDVGLGTPANRQNKYCFPQRSLDGLGHCSVGRPAMVSCHQKEHPIHQNMRTVSLRQLHCALKSATESLSMTNGLMRLATCHGDKEGIGDSKSMQETPCLAHLLRTASSGGITMIYGRDTTIHCGKGGSEIISGVNWIRPVEQGRNCGSIPHTSTNLDSPPYSTEGQAVRLCQP